MASAHFAKEIFAAAKQRFRGLAKLRASYQARRKFWRDFEQYRQMCGPKRQPSAEHVIACLDDATATTGLSADYFYQNAWAFECIVAQRPARHMDVGSHHSFVSLLSKVVPVCMVDLRPLPVQLDTLEFKEGTILDLPFPSQSLESVSSLCVVEHIGLGRYGDPLDPDGTEKAIAELKRVVRPGGDLYISLPLDDENRVYFNAHRAFAETYAREMFAPFSVRQSRYIFRRQFLEEPRTGFGIGCFHLQAPGQPSA